MARCVKVLKKDAQAVLAQIRELNIADPLYKVSYDDEFLYIPIESSSEFETIEYDSPKNETVLSFKEELTHILSSEELPFLKTAFDIYGTIAVLEIDDELRHKEIEIANVLLKTTKTILTVLRKDGPHTDPYRTQKMKYLAGEHTKVGTVIENNVRITLDVEKVYFSPRLSNERMRIAEQVQDKENILCMFSGCAPQPCVIAKHANPSHIDCIELNPDAHVYALQNVKGNKIKNIHCVQGDVHEKVKDITCKYDRIIMNLPKNAFEFLDDALSVAKDKCIIHYYDMLHEDDFDTAKERVSIACQSHGFTPEFKGIFTCGHQGVKLYRICVDVIVRK